MLSWAADSETQLRRACDRCHAIKERCEWPPNGKQCERCLRLQHVCETVRPKGRPGRKPGTRAKRSPPETRRAQPSSSDRRDDGDRLLSFWAGLWTQYNNSHAAGVPKAIPDLALANLDHQHVVQRFLFHSRILDVFSVGSSFGEKVRGQVIPHMLLSKGTFLDGLLACAISWAGDVDDARAHPGRLSACYRHASSAISMLTSLPVGDFDSMIDCLMLGALVSTFTVRLRLYDTMAICRRTLGLIEPVYAVSNPARPELRVFLSCMVVWELRACLFSCAVPTLRFRPPAEAYVDRHVGLCGTLLPLFHDICELSHALACRETEDTVMRSELDAAEQSVRCWQPAAPEDLTTRFDAVEVAHMLCQAQAMQASALLVIHRLRYPFGVKDEPAQVLSRTILTQIEMAYGVTKQPVRCTDIPLLVACIELKGSSREKWFSDIDRFAGFSPQFGEHVRDALSSYWASIDASDTVSWSHLVASGALFLRSAQ
ncbi:hypothetical protein F4802DRAFT_442375 [Xylaria palmicola]|nr:hypothetical protein F4802DRAFT_442375 [Xylaria palmicola]